MPEVVCMTDVGFRSCVQRISGFAECPVAYVEPAMHTRAGDGNLPNFSQYADSSHPLSRTRTVSGASELALKLPWLRRMRSAYHLTNG